MRRSRRRCSGAVLCLLVAGACSGTPERPAESVETASTAAAATSTVTVDEPPLDVAGLQSALDDWSSGSGAGVSAAVRRSDGSAWAGAAGLADGTSGREVTAGDTFRIGSVTKTFTAAVVLQLVEEGVLGLDQPAAEVLPDLGLDPAITVRHVLGHRTGLRDGLEDAAWGSGPADPEQVVILSTRGGLKFEPGTHFDYCNANYILAALLIEAVEGVPAHVAISERILAPLVLESTFMAGRDERAVTALPDGDPEEAFGYDARDRVNYTAGAMASTSVDLVVFAESLFAGRLLEPATVQTMVTPGDPAGEGARYGLGVELTRWDDREAWGHRGGVRGYVSGVFFFPADGTTVAVVTNAWGAGDVWELLELVAAVALGAG